MCIYNDKKTPKILKNSTKSWVYINKIMKMKEFLPKLRAVVPEKLELEQVQEAATYIDPVTDQTSRAASIATNQFYQWITKILEIYKSYHNIETLVVPELEPQADKSTSSIAKSTPNSSR